MIIILLRNWVFPFFYGYYQSIGSKELKSIIFTTRASFAKTGSLQTFKIDK